MLFATMRSKLLLALAALLATCQAVGTVPARAQEAQGEAALQLLGQPFWHDTDDSLNLRLRIANSSSEALEDYSLSLIAHGRTTSRSALQDSFSSPPAFTTSAYQPDLPGEPIQPGSSLTVSIDDSLARLSSLANATEGGVYPVTIALFDVDGAELDSVTTPFIIYPSTPDTALNLVLVAPLNAVPSRGPGRVFSTPADASSSLEDAVLEDGWLNGLVAAVEDAAQSEVQPGSPRRSRGGRRSNRRRPRPQPVTVPGLQLGIAPTPRLIDELADMANGFMTRDADGERRVPPSSDVSDAAEDLLERLSDLLAQPTVQPLLTPYAFPDLPTLRRMLEPARMSAQINEGHLVLRNVLELEALRDWVLAPAGRLDQTTLEDLRSIGGLGEHAFLSQESIESSVGPARSGCPEPALSFTCPVLVRTAQGPTTGFVADASLQERLAGLVAGSDPRVELQRFFAELAQIREELPGRRDRVVQVTVPSLWHPGPRLARLLFEGLQDAPWIDTLTPRGALAASSGTHAPVPKRLAVELNPLRSQPDNTWFASLQGALTSVESFSRVRPPQERIQRLSRNVMVGESRLWWPDPALRAQGEGFADDTSAEVQSVFDSIEIGGIDEIRLTSRRGELPIEILNQNDFPVTVDVTFSSTELDLDRPVEDDQRIQPDIPLQLVEDMTVASSGIYTVRVSVTTPDGYSIADKQIEIRSTEFNEVALGITLGALAFLIFFYVARVVRRRRQTAEDQSSGAVA
jgi:Family of unknown function (DUF6049)